MNWIIDLVLDWTPQVLWASGCFVLWRLLRARPELSPLILGLILIIGAVWVSIPRTISVALNVDGIQLPAVKVGMHRN